MTKRLQMAVIMDPIERINYKKDTTLALMLEAQKRDWDIFYLEQRGVYLKDGRAFGKGLNLKVVENPKCWYQAIETQIRPLGEFDIILMRKDPPFDMEYIYTTYILQFAQEEGAHIVNDPQGLRDANEKLFAQWFKDCMPPTITTKDGQLLRDFIEDHQDVVLKPLHSMGGGSIFHLKWGDDNINVAIEVLTENGHRHIMAQRFIPEITSSGDKRIFLIDGNPLPYGLARFPAPGEIRGNLAAGGEAKGIPLSPEDLHICKKVGPTLRKKGLFFVGLDVIGGYLTEINVTSPTCVRELEAFYSVNVCEQFFSVLEKNYLFR